MHSEAQAQEHRLCGSGAPRSARARVGDRRVERRSRPQQAARLAQPGWRAGAGQVRLAARASWAPLGAVRGRGGARRGVRMGPGVQAQGAEAAARRRCEAAGVARASIHCVGFRRVNFEATGRYTCLTNCLSRAKSKSQAGRPSPRPGPAVAHAAAGRPGPQLGVPTPCRRDAVRRPVVVVQ